MKLIFYKTIEREDGPTGEPVMIVEDLASRAVATNLAQNLPVTGARLANWRQFADFFEIV